MRNFISVISGEKRREKELHIFFQTFAEYKAEKMARISSVESYEVAGIRRFSFIWVIVMVVFMFIKITLV